MRKRGADRRWEGRSWRWETTASSAQSWRLKTKKTNEGCESWEMMGDKEPGQYIYIFLFCFSLQEGADRSRARWKRREVSLGTDFLYCKRRRAPWIQLYSSFWEPCVCHLWTSLSILFLFFSSSSWIFLHRAALCQWHTAPWRVLSAYKVLRNLAADLCRLHFLFFYFSLILYDMSTGHLSFFFFDLFCAG